MTNDSDTGIIHMPKRNKRSCRTEEQWISDYKSAFQGAEAQKILVEREILNTRVLQIERSQQEKHRNQSKLEQLLSSINAYIYPNTGSRSISLQKELCQIENQRLKNMSVRVFNCSDNKFHTESELSTLRSSAKHIVSLHAQSVQRLENIVAAWNSVWHQTEARILQHDQNNSKVFKKIRRLIKDLEANTNGINVFIGEYKNNLEVANEIMDESPLNNMVLATARAILPRELREDSVLCTMLNKTLVGRAASTALLYSDNTLIPCQKPEIKRKQLQNSPYRSKN